jgi:predicted nucleic acid-binding protein
MIYLLDANAVSDLLSRHPKVTVRVREALHRGDTLAMCRPIHYKLLCGLLWRGATAKLTIFNQRILPIFSGIL